MPANIRRGGSGSNAKVEDTTEEPTLRSICEDAAEKIRKPDLKRPFSSLEDAIDRLLPYHLLGAERAEVTDRREAQEAEAAQLATRKEAYNAFITSRANTTLALIYTKHSNLETAELKVSTDSNLPSLAMQACATAAAQKELDQFLAEKAAKDDARIKAETALRMQQETAAMAIQAQRQMFVAAAQAQQAALTANASIKSDDAANDQATTPNKQPQQQQQQVNNAAATPPLPIPLPVPLAGVPVQPIGSFVPNAPGQLPQPATTNGGGGDTTSVQQAEAAAVPAGPLTEEEKKKQWEAMRAQLKNKKKTFR